MKILAIILLLFSTGVHARHLSPQDVFTICAKEGFSNCRLLTVIAQHESKFDNTKFNPERTGSYGLLQIQCSTARDVLGYKIKCKDLFNPIFNIKVGIHYLRYIRKTHKINDIQTWLAAYNAGKPIVCKYLNPGQCRPGEFINQEYVNLLYRSYISLTGDQG